jgi:hypothetical protein
MPSALAAGTNARHRAVPVGRVQLNEATNSLRQELVDDGVGWGFLGFGTHRRALYAKQHARGPL